jgi:hypothetical protein
MNFVNRLSPGALKSKLSSNSSKAIFCPLKLLCPKSLLMESTSPFKGFMKIKEIQKEALFF